MGDMEDKYQNRPTKHSPGEGRGQPPAGETADDATQVLDFWRQPGDQPTEVFKPVFDQVQRADTQRSQLDPFSRGVTLLGEFELKRMLGSGGFSWVYLAQQRGEAIERLVAIKVLKRSGEASEFKAEADALAKLGNHPNIIQIHDARTTQGRDKDGFLIEYPWLAMQYAQGKTLKEWYKKYHDSGQKVPLDLFADVLDQIAAALDYAHEQGRVHRDIKPVNILFDENGQALLTDFGIALDISGKGQSSPYGSAFTPPYMSPEQVKENTADQRSDIYSLGVVLFEVLTGELPFTSNSVIGLQVQILQQPIPSIRERDRQLPRAVARVIQKGMDKDPDARYQSAGELAQAFRFAVGSGRRTLVRSIALATVALIVAAFIIFAVIPRQETQEISEAATVGAVEADVQQSKATAERQIVQEERATLTAEFIASENLAATATAIVSQATVSARETFEALPRPEIGVHEVNQEGTSSLPQNYEGEWACTIERYLRVNQAEVNSDGSITLFISQWIIEGDWDLSRWQDFPCPYTKDTDFGRRNMFLQDAGGNQIYYDNVGGAAGQSITMESGVEIDGWLHFPPPPPGHTVFDFYVSDEEYVIPGLDLGG